MEDRKVIAMAASGATPLAIAEKLKTSVETIERKARALGISLRHNRSLRPIGKRGPAAIGLKAKK